MSLGKRLSKFREYTGLSQVEFAEKVGVSQANITHWENDRSRPNSLKMNLIEKAFPILNTGWLISGTGDMLKQPIVTDIKVSKENSNLSENERIAMYRKENQELLQKIKILESRVQMLTDKILEANEQYIKLLNKK